MSKSVISEGKTTQEAIEKGLKEINKQFKRKSPSYYNIKKSALI